MRYEWIIEKKPSQSEIDTISSALNNLDHLTTTLLMKRGITNIEQAKEFFYLSDKQLHDPFLMKDMEKAVSRLEIALKNQQKILVYGDYDVDGTTSVSLVYKYLKTHTDNIDFYIPDRYTEGYGISFQGIDFAKENNFDLVIALDCGIKAVDKIEYANKKGVDFIICDHHTPGDNVPNAVAILDAKQTDCKYPYKELSGCGVGFKFMQAFAISQKLDTKSLFELIDLVAVSIASDIVPITGENRVLAHLGLEKFHHTSNNGLKALKEISGKQNDKFMISDLVFQIGPRINAAGRMKHAGFAVELLTEPAKVNAKELAQKLDDYNKDRKDQQSIIFNEVEEIFDNNKKLLDKNMIVVYKENWNKGIIGIVASKIVEKYYKPTIILTKSNDKWTGSARSVLDFNLYKAIDNCSEFLYSFGGHKYAAGLTIEDDKLHKFIDAFDAQINKTISDDILTPKLIISGIINFKYITNKLYKTLKHFAPFGPENMKPVFLTTDLIDTGASRLVGKDFSHLKLELKDSEGKILSGIAFGMGEIFNDIKNKKKVDVCYTIDQNNFNGNTNLQLDIKDVNIR